VQPIDPGNPIPQAQAARIVAAARELFEETGVLLARNSDNSFPISGAQLASGRRELTNQKITFRELLSSHRLSIYQADFVQLGNVVTPPFAPIRYDTTFFLARLPVAQDADIWPGELDQGFWSTAKDVLSRWKRGECLVSPPTVVLLQALEGQPSADTPARLAGVLHFHSSEEFPPIYFPP